jgi:hypothetical protein
MTEQEHAVEPDVAASPYMSLRQAVRPAIFAYCLLAGDQERAGKLAAECEDLLLLTRDLLKATGHARVLGAGHEAAQDGGGDRQARLLDAYAEAGLLWAKVVGSSIALARTLLDRGDWAEVRRLADVFAAAGEKTAAADLRTMLGEAVWETCHEPLRGIRGQMPPDEVRNAIDALRTILREIPEELPTRNAMVNRCLPPLAASIHAIMKQRGIEASYDSRVGHIAAGGVAKYPDLAGMSLDELSAEFEDACG